MTAIDWALLAYGVLILVVTAAFFWSDLHDLRTRRHRR